METQNIKAFLKSAIESPPFSGTRYHYLDSKWAIVLAYDGASLLGKIAYNCDDLQCDYDFDWYMPQNASGETFDTEVYNVQSMTADVAYTTFVGIYTDNILSVGSERCVICGAPIPEGQQACGVCKLKI